MKQLRLTKSSGRNIQKYLSWILMVRQNNFCKKPSLQPWPNRPRGRQVARHWRRVIPNVLKRSWKKFKPPSVALFSRTVKYKKYSLLPGKRDKTWTSSLWNGHLRCAPWPRDKGEKAKAAKAKANVATWETSCTFTTRSSSSEAVSLCKIFPLGPS